VAPEAAGGELAAALQRFQAAHGLPATGQLDPATLEQLNVPAAGRAAQIRASLERLRWLPRPVAPTRIDVNIPAAVMDYYLDGKLVTHMLAASGKPGDETPMLASTVDEIVLNPPWNVPEGIARDEILPKGEAYLRAKGFVVKDGRLVQQPGPDAALGLVKFDFANPYSVYLHDTPAKAAFSQTQRTVSHGCVRLAQAVAFAKILLAQEPGWSPQRVDDVLASGETTHIRLSRHTPVRLMYLTAFTQGDHVAFRPDVYGWDAELLRRLDRPS
jgi:murein L,D-transpeptidase YcbB/YkuD